MQAKGRRFEPCKLHSEIKNRKLKKLNLFQIESIQWVYLIMKMSMNLLADHILSVAQKNQKSINNLKLQKVMYFVLKDSRDKDILSYKTLREIYDDPFLVWDYGPSTKGQYYRFKFFRSAPIIGKFEYTDELSVLDNLIADYLDCKLIDLVNESFDNSFWKNNKNQICGFRSKVPYNFSHL